MNSRTTQTVTVHPSSVRAPAADIRDVVARAVGLIPAAGIASRLMPCVYPKELLPVTYELDPRAGVAVPVPVIERSLRALASAGVSRCLITVSPQKPELVRYLGDGRRVGLHLGFIQQSEPKGLVDAVCAACRWIDGCYGCLVLPDTVVTPPSAMAVLLETMARDPVDAVLGVFPTSTPEQLGPVRFDPDGTVREVLEKPAHGGIANTWGMVVFSPAFIVQMMADQANGLLSSASSLADVFNRALAHGARLRAVWFEEGAFLDAGTTQGLFTLLQSASEADLCRTRERA